MYAAEMSMYCGIDVWQPNSILIHAKSSKSKEELHHRKDGGN